MSQPLTTRALILSGVAAGLTVGLGDGIFAALQAHATGPAAIACVVLVLSLYVLLGTTLGAVVASFWFGAHWGRARQGALLPRVLGWLAVGAVAAATTAGAVVGTAGRNNRFLAAGVVLLALWLAGVAGALVGPALARLLGGGKTGTAHSPVTSAGLWLAAPMGALVLGLCVFMIVWRTRAPLRGPALTLPLLAAASVAGIVPWALARLSSAAAFVSRGKAVGVALLVFGLPIVVVARARWTQDLQFLPWPDIAGGVALLAVTFVFVGLLRRRALTVNGTAAWLVGVGVPAFMAVFVAGAWEPARKAATAHAAMVGTLLDSARAAFDFDRDGYPRVLGGGDCNDRDPAINPGAFDWPDDGIDQDCDGRDASLSVLQPAVSQPVPDTVPAALNVLFVTIDTLRADHLGCYGYARPTSPVLDALAAQGTLFENGWAHAPSTRYSMPALATGRWPAAIAWGDCIGCESWWPRIATPQVTVAEAFHQMGYLTAAFYSYSYFRQVDARGFERGVDQYHDERAALHVNVNGPMESVGTSSREVADDVIAFLQAQRDRKFFAWVHFYDPHLGYERHPEAPAFGDAAADLYDGEIWYTDHHFGRVLATLQQLGLDGRTAIFVTGDHGEGLGEHNIKAHGYDLYAPQTKVPFIARVPGLAPRRVAVPVGHVDIAPTLVNLARGPQPPTFLGRSLVDLMVTGTASGSAPAPVFQEVVFEGPTVRRALASQTHHLIWRVVPDNTTECYDLAKDPTEAHDLWQTSAGEPACSALKNELADRVATLALHKIADGVTPVGGHAPSPAVAADARLGTALRFVGYDLSAPTVARGGQVDLVTHFESLESLTGWRMFFHLEGPGGFRNLDHVPVDGAYPLDRWRPGQRIRDRQRIGFPQDAPPGVYTLYVGLFRRGGERMPVTPPEATDGRNRLRVATIVVN